MLIDEAKILTTFILSRGTTPPDRTGLPDANRRTVLKALGAGALLGGTTRPVAAQEDVTVASSEVTCYEEKTPHPRRGTLWEDYSYTLSEPHWIHQHFVVIDATTREEIDTAQTLVGDIAGEEIDGMDGREDLGEYAQDYNNGDPVVLDIVITDAESGEQIDRLEAPQECYDMAIDRFGEDQPPADDDDEDDEDGVTVNIVDYAEGVIGGPRQQGGTPYRVTARVSLDSFLPQRVEVQFLTDGALREDEVVRVGPFDRTVTFEAEAVPVPEVTESQITVRARRMGRSDWEDQDHATVVVYPVAVPDPGDVADPDPDEGFPA